MTLRFFALLCLLSVLSPLFLTAQPIRCGFLSDSERVRVSKIAQGIAADRVRPTLPEFADDAEGLFRVHFTRTGTDAVPSTDNNANSIPDYVELTLESLHRSWRLFTDTLETITVPRDGTAGGSSAYDVYLLDLSTEGFGLYGETVPEGLVSSAPYPRYTSWMQIDNNFATTDRNIYGQPVFATFGEDGLKITCAHELHHVVQIGAHGDAGVQLMMYEMTSTWMEQRTYPDIRDWVVYASNFFKSPSQWVFNDPSSSNGYVWGWFPNAYRERVGDALIGALWSRIGEGQRPFNALVDASFSVDYPLDSAFINALPHLYHTGSRATDNTVLPGAEELPEIYLAIDDDAEEPATVHAGTLRPFEVRAFRYQVPASNGGADLSVGIVITWADLLAYTQTDAGRTQSYTITLTPSPLDGDIPISGTTWAVRVQGALVAAYVDGGTTQFVPSPYPQPLVLSTSTRVHLPVVQGKPGDQVRVRLMTVQTLGILEQQATITLDDIRLIATIDVPHDLTPGTYLVGVGSDGNEALYKLVVKR